MHAPAPRPGLPAVGIFAEFDAAEREALAAELEMRALKRGDVLVRQGDAADALFIVLSGRFAVMIEGRRDPITEIGPDQPIGEIAFLTEGKRTATVTAMRDSLVLRLGRAEFERLSDKSPSIWRTLTCALSQRLAATTASEAPAPDPRPRTIAIIRAGAEPVPQAFVEALTSVFAAAAKTLVLDAERATQLLPKACALDSAEVDAGLERAGKHLRLRHLRCRRRPHTLVAKGGPACRPGAGGRHAFGQSDAKPPGEARRRVREPAKRAAWCFCTRTAGRSQALPAGCAGARVAMHHHVAMDEREDIERLFRFINGTALGLVACGGGALCAAHVGLYKALIESRPRVRHHGRHLGRCGDGRRLRHGQASRRR